MHNYDDGELVVNPPTHPPGGGLFFLCAGVAGVTCGMWLMMMNYTYFFRCIFSHPRSEDAARSAAPARRPRGWSGYLAKSKGKKHERSMANHTTTPPFKLTRHWWN